MDYRNGIKQFSNYKGFQGWVIAKAVYQRSKISCAGIGQGCILVKQRSRSAILQSSWIKENMEESVTITLMKPDREMLVEDAVHRGAEKFCKEGEGKFFSIGEIQDFVTDVKDDNAIHRTSHPIVPGLEILENVLSKIDTQEVQVTQEVHLEIYFKHPLFAGRKVEIRWKDTTGTKYGKEWEFEGINDKVYFNGKLTMIDGEKRKNEIET